MGGCLRRACPCLEALCLRVRGDKPGVDGGRGPEETPDKPAGGDSTYTALWPFEARHREELSFREGDLFRVVSRNGDWWTARKIDHNGSVLDSGIVPFNYLERTESVRSQPCFFGTMNRFEAQSHLLSPGNDHGAFLVRRSERDDVGLVLSVKLNVQVKHFKILQTDDRSFHIETGRGFPSLMNLVEHYRSNSLCGMGRLGNLCKRKRPSVWDLCHCTVEAWELPKDQFTLEEELGSGFFADVYRGRWRNHSNVAIKIIKSDSELNHREFQREVQILKSLRHRHLISLFAVCTASAPYYIITELMDKGSLLNFLRGAEGQRLDTVSLVDMGAQVADGMSYLEEKNSIHRDLAARNVLVGDGYVCKVADFGLARVIKEPFYVTEDKKIPFKWSAPEAISHGKFSNKSDVWSFGVLLYEIVTYGGVPYPAFSNQEVYQQVSNGYRMPLPLRCPAFLYDIMLRCWSAEPDQRPDFRWLRLQLDRNSYELQ